MVVNVRSEQKTTRAGESSRGMRAHEVSRGRTEGLCCLKAVRVTRLIGRYVELGDEQPGHCVHDLARQGNDLDAQIEKFFDDVLIDDIKQTPVCRMDA